MTASLWRKRVKWLVRSKGPVSHFPGGTTSAAPPSRARRDRSATALANAAVLSVLPSPTAPYSVTFATCFRHPGPPDDAPARAHDAASSSEAAHSATATCKEKQHE